MLIKKKLVMVTVVLVFFISIFATNVYAWTAAFDGMNKTYEYEKSITGGVISATNLLKKFTYSIMIIRTKISQPGFLGIGWSQMGSTEDCQVNEGTGNINKYCSYMRSSTGTKNFKGTWQQITDGQLSATIDLY